MTARHGMEIQRWTPASRRTAIAVLLVLAVLAVTPAFGSPNLIVKLTTLLIYILLACMWNALAGYGGLISVGQQAFFGLGAYATVMFSDMGVHVYLALVLGIVAAGIASAPLSWIMLRLKGGEFAIGMWVLAAIIHLLVIVDPMVQGETGISLIALNAFEPGERRNINYWMTLGFTVFFVGMVFVLLRSRLGTAIQAIRDDEVAAASVGVPVMNGKRIIFVLAAFGCAAAGALWLATAITFQPKTYFGINWTAYMVFMVLVGGIGTFEGPIIGALIFFILQDRFGESGVWYLIVLGATAVFFALFVPRGIWGTVEDRWGARLLPLGFRLSRREPEKAQAAAANGGSAHEV